MGWRENVGAARMRFALAIVLWGWAGPAYALKTEQAAPLQPVIACRSITVEADRLRCYDQAVQQLAERSASGSIVIVSREEVRQARRSAFGLTLPKLPFFDNANSKEEEPQEVSASIRSARSLGNGLWQLDLDSAGIWQTTDALTSARTPKPGHQIKIRKGSLGSYFIRMSDGRNVKGLRVR
jgi:hypothetical protein